MIKKGQRKKYILEQAMEFQTQITDGGQKGGVAGAVERLKQIVSKKKAV